MIDAAPMRQDMQRELPDGWRWVRMLDVGHFESGGTPSKDEPRYWNGSVPFVTGADITKQYISADNARAFLTNAGLHSGKTAACQPGTVLFVTRTRVGRVGIANETMGVSQDLSPYICGPDLLPDYVYHYLSSLKDYLLANCRGSTILGLTRSFVESLSIPLPPLAEQHRIVAILSQQLSAVEQARLAAEAQLAAAKELPAAYLRAVFESEAARGWSMVRLGELAIVGPDNGAFKRRHEFGHGVPFVNVSDLYKGLTIDLHRVERVEASQDEQDRYGINSGDLFFCRSSLKREGIGWCAYVSDVTEPTIFDCHVMRIRLDPLRAIPQYIAYYWQHPLVRQAVIDNSRTATMTTMNQEDLARIEIPIPPLTIQKQLVALLAEKFAAIDAAREAVEAQMNTINHLPAALLRRAFSGEL